MAEGMLTHIAGDRCESLSAGSDPAGYVHPQAIEAMNEIELDITQNKSKSINDFLPPDGTPPDLIISVCSGAEKSCPFFPGNVDRKHWPFDDPAHATGTEEEKMLVFRRVRDEIRTRLEAEFG
jgi:arsenate reductase (thioredoxin)